MCQNFAEFGLVVMTHPTEKCLISQSDKACVDISKRVLGRTVEEDIMPG